MPTINLPNNNVNPPVANNTPPVVQPPVKPADPWGAPPMGGNDWGWGQNNPIGQTPSSQEKKLTPNERVEMIEKLYEEVLGRKADTRDINYYKYSTLGTNEIREQLISGKEHKQLIIDGKEYKKMKDRAIAAEARVRMLENQIKDQVAEFQQLTNLLSEKNKHIKALREQKTSIYNLNNQQVNNDPQTLSNDINGSVYNAPKSEAKKTDRDDKVGIVDIIKSLIP